MLFGNARIHRGFRFLSFSHTFSFSRSFFYLLCVPLSPSLLLLLYLSHSIAHSHSLSLSNFTFLFLFLPYFNEFVADFEASNTDTQPYQMPHKIIITIIIETQFIYIQYIYIVWYGMYLSMYIHTRRSMYAYARADNNNNIDFSKVIVHPVRLFFFAAAAAFSLSIHFIRIFIVPIAIHLI